jgi:hypothetical protein
MTTCDNPSFNAVKENLNHGFRVTAAGIEDQ